MHVHRYTCMYVYTCVRSTACNSLLAGFARRTHTLQLHFTNKHARAQKTVSKKKNVQVTINYGQVSNDILLQCYGFVERAVTYKDTYKGTYADTYTDTYKHI